MKTPPKPRSLLSALTAAAFACLTNLAGSADGAVIFGTNFSVNTVNTTDTDSDGAGADTLNATGITWTTNGIATPSSTLTFSGDSTAFLLPSTTSSFILPNANIGSGFTWSTSVQFSLNPSTTIDLTTFQLNWIAKNGTGSSQTANRPANWTVGLVGSTSGNLGSLTVLSGTNTHNGASVSFDLQAGPNLNAGETYTLSLSVLENNTSGFTAQLNDFQLSGNISAIPEPRAALLGLLGILLPLRRQR